jgi:RNA polymerase sigma factor (sigma-70 family)
MCSVAGDAALPSRSVSEISYMGRVAEQAFRDYYGRIFRYVRSRTASEAEAEDIAQTVFAEAAARLDSSAQSSVPVLAWLYTVAQRRLIDAARLRARSEPPVPLELVGDVPLPEPSYGTEVADGLKQAIAALSRSQRHVVVARLLEGRSFAEIAVLTGSTQAACKMRFSRSLVAIRKRLEEEGVMP